MNEYWILSNAFSVSVDTIICFRLLIPPHTVSWGLSMMRLAMKMDSWWKARCQSWLGKSKSTGGKYRSKIAFIIVQEFPTVH